MKSIHDEVLDSKVDPLLALSPSELVTKFGGTKSAAIRALLADGYERKEVAGMLKIRYQHVRNVQITPIKKQFVRV